MSSDKVAKINSLLAKKKEQEKKKIESRPALKKYMKSYKKDNKLKASAKHESPNPKPDSEVESPQNKRKISKVGGSTLVALRAAKASLQKKK